MKPRPDFFFFRTDKSWYEEFWFAPEPIKQVGLIKRLCSAAPFRRPGSAAVRTSPRRSWHLYPENLFGNQRRSS